MVTPIARADATDDDQDMTPRTWLWRIIPAAIVVAGVAWFAIARQPGEGPLGGASPPPAMAGIDAEMLAEGARGEVAIAGLRLSGTPGGQPFVELEEGRGVSIIGAAEHDGVRWWLVQVSHLGNDLFGWVPGLLRGTSTLLSLAPSECPDDPSLGSVGSIEPADRLRCWSDRRISFEGWVIAYPLPVEAYAGRPEWLASHPSLAITVAIGPAIDGPAIPFHLPPEMEPPPLTPRDGPAPDQQVRITGRFDDPRSTNCRHEPRAAGVPPLDAELSVLWCRQRFVIEDWMLVPAG